MAVFLIIFGNGVLITTILRFNMLLASFVSLTLMVTTSYGSLTANKILKQLGMIMIMRPGMNMLPGVVKIFEKLTITSISKHY
jgi:uracil phosphoribosyltransferase